MVYNDDEDDMEKTGHKRKERSRRLKERLERRYSFRMYRSSQRPTNLFTSASGGDLFLSLFFFFPENYRSRMKEVVVVVVVLFYFRLSLCLSFLSFGC